MGFIHPIILRILWAEKYDKRGWAWWQRHWGLQHSWKASVCELLSVVDGVKCQQRQQWWDKYQLRFTILNINWGQQWWEKYQPRLTILNINPGQQWWDKC